MVIEFNRYRSKLSDCLLRFYNDRGCVIRKKVKSVALPISDRQRKSLDGIYKTGIGVPVFQPCFSVALDCFNTRQGTHYVTGQLAEKKPLFSQQQRILSVLNSLAQFERSICGSVCRSAEHKYCYGTNGSNAYRSPVCEISDVRGQRTDFDCHAPSFLKSILP